MFLALLGPHCAKRGLQSIRAGLDTFYQSGQGSEIPVWQTSSGTRGPMEEVLPWNWNRRGFLGAAGGRCRTEAEVGPGMVIFHDINSADIYFETRPERSEINKPSSKPRV